MKIKFSVSLKLLLLLVIAIATIMGLVVKPIMGALKKRVIDKDNQLAREIIRKDPTDKGLERLKELKHLSEVYLTEIIVDCDVDNSSLVLLDDCRMEHTGDIEISDNGLIYLKELTNLKKLSLDGVEISDKGLEHLKGLTNLKELSLQNTPISDKGLEYLKGLNNLKVLYLMDTKISDKGLEYLEGFTNLEVLGLSGTKISNKGLEHLKELTCLKKLWLDDTKVSEKGVKELEKALPNCEISDCPGSYSSLLREFAR